MQKFSKYFAITVIVLYFVLGVWILLTPRLSYLKQEIRVIFAIFLFLYGAYRLARVLTRRDSGENQ